MRAITYSLTFIALSLSSVVSASAQENLAQAQAKTPNTVIDAKILFTGKLLGYFRIPDRQPATGEGFDKCPTPQNKLSRDVQDFLNQAKKDGNTVLVGTGDNFAPELFARTFDHPPYESQRNKDRYFWDWLHRKWVSYDDCDDEKKCDETVLDAMAHGLGRIPMDNVGCFLARAGYNAIVPGKQDFFFGPERLRYLARFLMSFPEEGGDYNRVHMLATNLVIQTAYSNGEKPRPDNYEGVAYLTPSRTAELAKGNWGNTKPDNISDKGTVLPWLQTITVKTDLANLDSVEAQLCEADKSDPNKLTDKCTSLPKTQQDAGKYNFSLSCDPLAPDQACKSVVPGESRERLLPGENYMFCLRNNTNTPYCTRFSVYSPFFTYKAKPWEDNNHPTDPDRYVIKDLKNGTKVAIFGVVDQDLREHVGQLNFAWSNHKKRYKTEILIVDPVIALTQLLEKFDKDNSSFSGIKVLIAQMGAPQAKQLAAQLSGKFNVVIGQAQLEHATPNQTTSIDLTEVEVDEKPSRDALRQATPSFLAIPPPYYDPESGKREVQVRELHVLRTPGERNVWWFSVNAMKPKGSRLESDKVCNEFTEKVYKAVDRLVSGNYKKDPEEAFHLLTLHTMLKAIDADVALIQKRDIFWHLPPDECNSGSVQNLLDRILWKGDFLMRRHIPGKTLKEILVHSKQYDADDQSPVSLAVEKKRALVKLGVRYDEGLEEYFINGVALDPNRLYTVATTDYIGLGDTGFPELSQSAVGDPLHPRDFHTLHYISSLICKEIGGPCESQIRSKFYFDELNQEPTDLSPRITNLGRLKAWAFHGGSHPQAQAALPTQQDLLERRQQDRAVFSVALDKLSFGFSSARHRFSEEERSDRFSGIPIPQLNAFRSHSWDFDFRLKTTRAGEIADLFAIQELRYVAEITRQEKGPTLTNQKTNMLALEGGTYLHWTKNLPRLVFLVAPRYETQLINPISVFKLGNDDSLIFSPGKSKTILLKIGPRWEDRKSFIEGGYLVGHQFNAITQFVLSPGTPSEIICKPTLEETVQECVIKNSKPDSPFIMLGSNIRVDRDARFRHGFFMNFKLTVPLHSKVSYILENQGEFFFTRPPDNFTDTRYQDIFKQAVSFQIFGNLYFEPKFEVFLYENKVEREHFWQTQTAFTINYKFNWFAGNKWWDAMRYKDPGSK